MGFYGDEGIYGGEALLTLRMMRKEMKNEYDIS